MNEDSELQQKRSNRSVSPASSGRSSSLDEAFDDENAPEEEPTADKNCVSYTYEEMTRKQTFSALPQKQRERWSRAALGVSISAILATLTFSFASFMVSRETESSSIFASAFDAFLGALSSLIVAWRFRDVKNGDVAPVREKTATLGIAVSFIASGIATIISSSVHLSQGDHPRKPNELIVILSASLVCFTLLGYVQQCISSKLDSQCLRTAAVDSWLAAALSAGILASTFVYRQERPDLWFLDHTVALLIGTVSTIYGTKLVVEILILKAEWRHQMECDEAFYLYFAAMT